MRPIRLALAMLLAAPGAALAQAASTLTPEGLRTGVLTRETDCPERPGHAWVTAPHPDGRVEGVCMRYYAHGLSTTAATPRAVVYMHGNRLNYVFDAEGRQVRIDASAGYGNPTEALLHRGAERRAATSEVPFIFLGRPGNYGSSGIAAEQYRRREGALVNATLDIIKRRYRIEAFGIAAQSGGGPALAGVLAQRDDVACAAFSSALTAVSVLERERAATRTRAPTLTERVPDLYDPILRVADLRPSTTRRIFIVWDTSDRTLSHTSQQAYAEALRGRGIQVAGTASTAAGTQRHTLAHVGQRAVAWCLQGALDAEILDRMRRGEAAYLVDDGLL